MLVWIVECLYHSVTHRVSHTHIVFHIVPCLHMGLVALEKNGHLAYGKYYYC